MFVSQSALEKEKTHIADFAPEVGVFSCIERGLGERTHQPYMGLFQ